mgnify:CR=1
MTPLPEVPVTLKRSSKTTLAVTFALCSKKSALLPELPSRRQTCRDRLITIENMVFRRTRDKSPIESVIFGAARSILRADLIN